LPSACWGGETFGGARRALLVPGQAFRSHPDAFGSGRRRLPARSHSRMVSYRRVDESFARLHRAGWSADALALLGMASDAKVAERFGRTEGAVTLKRCRLRIPTFCDRRRETHRDPLDSSCTRRGRINPGG
jgi:hypothetical protein